MTGRQAEISTPAGAGWLKVNPGHTGFYRVMYESEELGRLADAVERGGLSPADRLGIADDAFALCRAGMLGAQDFLDLATRYKGEPDQSVWANLTGSLGSLDSLIEGEDCHEQFRAFARISSAPSMPRSAGRRPRERDTLPPCCGPTCCRLWARLATRRSLPRRAGSLSGTLCARPAFRGPEERVFVLTARAGDERTYETMWDLQAAEQLQRRRR